MQCYVYVRFQNVGDKDGTPFSYEPRKWMKLFGLGVRPDLWSKDSLDLRVKSIGLSEFEDSLNFGLFTSDSMLPHDLQQLKECLTGAIQVQTFNLSSTTPVMQNIPSSLRRRTELSLKMESVRTLKFPGRLAS
jgi:hypothetical protein